MGREELGRKINSYAELVFNGEEEKATDILVKILADFEALEESNERLKRAAAMQENELQRSRQMEIDADKLAKTVNEVVIKDPGTMPGAREVDRLGNWRIWAIKKLDWDLVAYRKGK